MIGENEGIILSTSNARLYRSEVYFEELVLTSKSILYELIEQKGSFFRRQIKKHPIKINLKDVKIGNNGPQVFVKENPDSKSEWLLQIFEENKTTTFCMYDKKGEVWKKWQREIFFLIMGYEMPDIQLENRVVAGAKKGKEVGEKFVDVVTNDIKNIPLVGGLVASAGKLAGGIIGGVVGGLFCKPKKQEHSKSVITDARNFKCSGCGANLSGYVGQRIKCEYCDKIIIVE